MAPQQASVGAIVAAVLLPPLGIFLARGFGMDFWIGTVLTLLGWVPGVLFALMAILRPQLLHRA